MKNIGAAEITTPTDHEIVITRVFDATRAVVFEAWTKAEHVAHWWDPSGVPLAVSEIDLRPGGAFRFVHRAPEGAGHSFTGTYREIVPPAAPCLRDARTNRRRICRHTRIRGARSKTVLTMTIACASKADRDALLQMRIDAGTAQTLENLAAYLPKIA